MAISKEAKKRYDELWYQKRREITFKDKKCPACGIPLISKFGAQGTMKYCRDCVKWGYARKHQNQVHYKKYRARILARVKQYALQQKQFV